jgi:trk system potassium uptake protein TrkH
MDFRVVFYVLSFLSLCLSGTLLVPMGISFGYGEEEAMAFLVAAAICGGIGLGGLMAFRSERKEIGHREGFAIVGLGWMVVCLLGALPYLFAGTFSSAVNACFESTSGFTTTGATVVQNIELLPKGILFWRSLTHWLGGMGIILLSMAILPMLGVGGMQLYRAEVPGPVPDRLKPRIRETAKTLWMVYVLISLLEVVFLLVGGMSVFDAVCHTFGTMATGGFSTQNASIGHYESAYIEGVITVFMIAAGANFALHYQLLQGNPGRYFQDREFRFYLFAILMTTAGVAILLRTGTYEGWTDSVRYAVFQVSSILTTTGYTTADYEQWPLVVQYTLFCLMFFGGCAGSTGGSVKCIRILLLLKQAYKEIYRLIHPQAVATIKLGKKTVPPDVMESVLGFSLVYVGIFVGASLLMSWLGLDFKSALASVGACIGNVGPGLGIVGPTKTYLSIVPTGKWILILCMIMGRLEIFTLLILFLPQFWKK